MLRRLSSVAKYNTPLLQIHQKLDAKFTEFANYNMPLTYNNVSTKNLVINTRKNGISIFDISHMGIIKVKSNNIEDSKILLEKIFPVNLDVLKLNRSTLTILLNHSGYITDDLIISNLGDEYRLVVNAYNKFNIMKLLQEYNKKSNILLENKSIIAMQGKKSQALLEDIIDTNLSGMYFNDNLTINNNLEISRTGYTGEDGFEIYLDNQSGIEMYEKIIDKQNDYEIYFGGLMERDILRLEAGLCLSGVDFGSDMLIKFNSLNMNFLVGNKRRIDKNFIGGNYLEGQTYLRRVGFISDTPIKIGEDIFNSSKQIGYITSSTKSFNLNKFISMGYISNKNNEEPFVILRGKRIPLSETSLPFVPHKYFRKT